MHKKEYRNPSLRQNLRKGEQKNKIKFHQWKGKETFMRKVLMKFFFSFRIGFSIYKIYWKVIVQHEGEEEGKMQFLWQLTKSCNEKLKNFELSFPPLKMLKLFFAVSFPFHRCRCENCYSAYCNMHWGAVC